MKKYRDRRKLRKSEKLGVRVLRSEDRVKRGIVTKKGYRINLYFDPTTIKGAVRQKELEGIQEYLKDRHKIELDITDSKFWWTLVRLFRVVSSIYNREKAETDRKQEELDLKGV